MAPAIPGLGVNRYAPAMTTIPVPLPQNGYDVEVGPGLLARLGHLVHQVASHSRAAIISDQSVCDTYGAVAERALAEAGYDTHLETMPSGERHKNLQSYARLMDGLLAAALERASPVVALGGGVTGDTAGFVAATYMRGVPLVQCPTTLLAMVDAAVGGKVAVNAACGKNLIGAFYQPCLVVIDTNTLSTLPPRQLRCGLAEAVKHGMIRDSGLFDFIGQHASAIDALDPAIMVDLVHRNVRIKAAVVSEDQTEEGVRAHLNFGHTFAHAIEATVGYGKVLHGEAVSLGMVAATALSVRRGQCQPRVLEQLTQLLETLNLPTVWPNLPATKILLDAMKRDKKVQDDQLRLVLPCCIGEVTIVADADDGQVAEAWDRIRS